MPNPTLTIRAKPSALRSIMSPAKLGELLKQAQAELANDSEIIFASFALHRSGRMARAIHTVSDGGDLVIETEARDPVTGFDYVRITRFGHRTYRIVPKRPVVASVVATRGARSRGRTAALRMVIGGRVLYRRSSRGFHPATDWAADALPAVKLAARRRLGTLSRRIEVEWSK